MMKKIREYYIQKIPVTVAFLLLFIVQSFSQQVKPAKSGYAPVNGLKMYYEVHGKGAPVILLHGAFMSIEGMFRDVIAEYSKTRQVIALEFQAHGRTNDIDRDITYENLADDVNLLMQYLKVDSADVFAFSMGTSVALQLAIRHPVKVKKMVLLSGSYSDDGYQTIYKDFVPNLSVSLFEGSPFKKEYDSLFPNNKFSVLVERIKKLELTPFNWEKDYVKIKNPLLLVFGDNDVVTLRHANDMVTKLGGNVMGDMSPMPNVRLAVLPYTSHVGMMSRLKWVYPMAAEFLK